MQSLTYRSPKDEARFNRIRNCIVHREASFWGRIAVKFTIGIPFSFLGPVVITWFINTILLRFGIDFGWALLFFLITLIALPALYITEIRTRGEFLVEEMRAQGTTTSDLFSSTSRGELQLRRSAAATAGFIEIFLFAPRLTLEAITAIRTRVKLSDASMGRAAQLISTLQTRAGAIAISDLCHPEESTGDLHTILRYLQMHDWIDISADGKRTWLLSRARLRLSS